MSKKNPLIISFDGNIGSGKSTIVKYLQNNFESYYNNNEGTSRKIKIAFLQEPVGSWERLIDDNTDKNLIELFYESQNRYAFAFQINAYISRLSQFLKYLNDDYDVIITERSIFTDKNVFAKMLFDLKILESIEYKIYNKWFDEFSQYLQNLKIIYIKTKPETCLCRIINRKRKGENIDLNYLSNCHLYHEIWLNNISKEDLITIDGEFDIKIGISNNNDFDYFNDIMKKLYNFILKFL